VLKSPMTLTLATALLAAGASAQSFNLDLGGVVAPSDGYAAAALAGTWNVAHTFGELPATLVDVDGEPIPSVQITSNVPGLSAAGFDDPGTSGDDAVLLDDFVTIALSGADSLEIDVEGLENGTYRLVVYSWFPGTVGPTDALGFVLAHNGHPPGLLGYTTIGDAWTGEPEVGVTHAAFDLEVDRNALHVSVIGSFAGSSAAINGLQLIRDHPFVDLGQGLVGSGVHLPPDLDAVGTLGADAPARFTLLDARASATAFMVLGFSPLGAPFKGGTMVPDIGTGILLALPTDAAGKIAFTLDWPAGLPAGFETYWQYWIPDPAGPFGFTASNALAGTTP